ncbi:MAG: bifunctional DNA primase/polymerase [Actinobacteria bacterium]|jgi:hypothetical protein|nr:bifunctional DNA primase/polymerase [Actinomycetota bacterium]
MPHPPATRQPLPPALIAAAGERTLADAARTYADAGAAVFPCAPGAKRPLTTHGLLDASHDVRQVARWWHRWPNANIGLATGHQIDVVDVDLRPAGNGFVALDAAQSAGLTDGWACALRTPSSGLHLYYPAVPDRPQRSWSESSIHIDFRGAGGYVIVPPSRVTTDDGQVGRYQLIAIATHDPAPIDADALRTLLVPPRRRRPVPALDTPTRGDGRQLAAWVATQAEGNRNKALFWAACRYAEQQLPEEHAHLLLGPAAQHTGLSERDITVTIRSAYRTATPPVAVARRSPSVVSR